MSGSWTTARARAVRCCWPPLRSVAGVFRSSGIWTSSRMSITRSSYSAFGMSFVYFSG